MLLSFTILFVLFDLIAVKIVACVHTDSKFPAKLLRETFRKANICLLWRGLGNSMMNHTRRRSEVIYNISSEHY